MVTDLKVRSEVVCTRCRMAMMSSLHQCFHKGQEHPVILSWFCLTQHFCHQLVKYKIFHFSLHLQIVRITSQKSQKSSRYRIKHDGWTAHTLGVEKDVRDNYPLHECGPQTQAYMIICDPLVIMMNDDVDDDVVDVVVVCCIVDPGATDRLTLNFDCPGVSLQQPSGRVRYC
jgi:hypothetical protein